ncbi:DUF3042 domain-containing protein [Lactococcus hodotermopsidis]|uniref:DUF3042 domain-containing protein n=1 Tax=Pseudolactococcus hodotermopsidis TaxID=2709157 RepID=A0A6A0BDG9_9LACT|nr:DUF3042 family protein [Lactococcus hodotermopsidis]GFH42388.1 DUF3042 domain-containing protein [Lactococcus hodotermopsidis]
MNKFSKGLITGVVATVITTVGGLVAIKKGIIDPELKKEEFINENRRKAARKRIFH